MKSRINREAREISISELWWYVISKWKWLVIGMVVGALVLGAYGAYSAYRANESAKANVPKEYTMEDLTPEEQEEVEELIEDYEFYQAEVERLENNYLMNLDYNNVSYCLATYYVDTDYSYNYTEVKENYTSTLVSMYKTYAHSEVVHDKILSLNIEGLEEIDLPHIIGIFNEGSIIRIEVYGEKKYDELILNTICEAIEDYSVQANELVGEHKLMKIGSDIRPSYCDSIRSRQIILTAAVESLEKKLETCKQNMNEAQLDVYTNRINEIEDIEKEDVLSNQERNDLMNLKYIVIYAVLGLIGLIIVIICTYIGSGKIKGLNEIRQVYGVELIGKILRDNAPNRYVVKKINKINASISEMEQKQYVVETVINKCKQNEITELTICSTIENMEEKVIDVVNALKEAKIKCSFAGNINESIEAMKTVAIAENVILAEQLNATTKDDLEAEITNCDKLMFNILGMIVII